MRAWLERELIETWMVAILHTGRVVRTGTMTAAWLFCLAGWFGLSKLPNQHEVNAMCLTRMPY
jgi:hypothetical protein